MDYTKHNPPSIDYRKTDPEYYKEHPYIQESPGAGKLEEEQIPQAQERRPK